MYVILPTQRIQSDLQRIEDPNIERRHCQCQRKNDKQHQETSCLWRQEHNTKRVDYTEKEMSASQENATLHGRTQARPVYML